MMITAIKSPIIENPFCRFMLGSGFGKDLKCVRASATVIPPMRRSRGRAKQIELYWICRCAGDPYSPPAWVAKGEVGCKFEKRAGPVWPTPLELLPVCAL